MRFHQAAAAVWDEAAGGGSSPTPPQLSLFSLPAGVKGARHSPGPPPPTPPINSLVSVPFKWEEAPGKPRPRRLDHHHDAVDGDQLKTNPAVARCLELPPRLVVSSNSSSRVSNVPSPASVMSSFQQEEGEGDGHRPARRSMSFTHGCGRASSSLPGGGLGVGVGFGSSRWGSLLVMKMTTSTVRNKKDQQVANFDSAESSSNYVNDDDRSSAGEQLRRSNNNVKITRIRRRRSLFNLSASSRPQACLNRMYKSLKKIMMVSK